MSSKIVFFGNERLATGVTTETPVLRALVAAGYDVRAVILAQKPVGKSRAARTSEIMQAAEELRVAVQAPDNLRDPQDVDEIKAFGADIGVLVAYGKLVPQAVIDLFPHGIINIHPSQLPKHRGPTPLESVILNGERQTAVSLMQLAAKMDAGPIYAQQLVSLDGHETKQQLADRLLLVGRDILLAALPGILDGSLQPTPQDDTDATYDSLLTKDKSDIDWSRPAVEIERHIRANAGWPKSRTIIADRDVVITKAHAIPATDDAGSGALWLQDKQLGFYTSEGILVIDELVPAGKKPMSGADFMLGYRPQGL